MCAADRRWIPLSKTLLCARCDKAQPIRTTGNGSFVRHCDRSFSAGGDVAACDTPPAPGSSVVSPADPESGHCRSAPARDIRLSCVLSALRHGHLRQGMARVDRSRCRGNARADRHQGCPGDDSKAGNALRRRTLSYGCSTLDPFLVHRLLDQKVKIWMLHVRFLLK